jgi:hypothetical protein
MAKKKIPPHMRLTLHRDITEKRDTMIHRCGWLRDQGRLEEARRLFKRIEKLTEELTQLEGGEI